ncbi:MAG: hypothetical protein K2L27_00605 [Muribaculaceae bacterium]|nr:hypothetical protein [Muribaculaceae bacterium]
MKTKSLSALMLAAALCACDNEVFVEPTAPSASEISLDGPGSEATVKIVTRGLKYIYPDTYESFYQTAYDSEGREISLDSPASELARLNYTTEDYVVDMYRHGDELTFRCSENMDDMNRVQLSLRLDYGYQTELLKVFLLPAKKWQFVDIVYHMENMERSVGQVKAYAVHVENASDQELPAEIRPYLNADAVAMYAPSEQWALDRNISVQIPEYVATTDSWQLREWLTDMATNEQYKYFPANLDKWMHVDINVPPHTTCTIKSTVRMENVVVPYTMRFSNGDNERYSEGKCYVRQPVDYEITIE